MSRANILIVEDEIIIAKDIKASLESMGYSVTSIVKSGERAIEKAKQEHPDLILMDIKLKGDMDGIELSQLIRSSLDIPIVFLTAYADEEKLERAKLTLPFGYVLKPFRARDLKVTIEMALYTHAEEVLKQKTHDLGERVKELNCLYSISDLVEKPDVALDEIIQGIVDIIPVSWQYPEVTCSRILLDGQEYKTENFKETYWKQTSDIFVYDQLLGFLEVCYLEEKPEIDEGPFLKEERDLINAITERLGKLIEQKQTIEEKERLEAELHQSHKMEAIGTLAGGIAHEFNNILGIIIGNTELGIMGVPEWSPAKNCLEEIRSASLRAKDVVWNILSFTRKSVTERKPVSISPIIRDSFKLLRAIIPSPIEMLQNIACENDIIMADPTQINQVLVNLCTNSAHAMREEGGFLDVSLENVTLDENTVAQYYEDLSSGNHVKLTVKDTGHGIKPETIDRIFDPYFTTKGIGEGTGMGLAVINGIVKNHDGIINVKSEPGKGTVVEVLLPVTEAENEPEVMEPDDLPTGNEKILFVDDEESLLKMGHLMLIHLGYQVETNANPDEALELFRSKPDKFDLVITDMTMPQMTGDKLAKELMEIRPYIPIIISTGFSEKIDEYKAKEMGIHAFTMKPLVMRDLAVTVRKVLDDNS
jgi:signal transduction histidine kinase/DNA-binding response OmpR family regulator